jgi:hypothetical protein
MTERKYNPETRRARYERNREAEIEYSRRWRAANPDKKRAQNREWYANGGWALQLRRVRL